jgi:predicted dehydrogenase
MKLPRIGVVGVGHLGKAHARILAGMPEVDLVGVVDVQRAQAVRVAQDHGAQAFTDYRELAPLVDAAVIAVPTVNHHAVACEYLSRGIALLVEKPLTPGVAEADQLVDLATRKDVLLQVGHIERFNPVYQALQSCPLRPAYIRAERLGPFSGRSLDIGVVLDLMIHDLDLVQTLVGARVQTVSASGMTLLGGHEDVVHARLTFANGSVADLSASRVHPTAVRRLTAWGPEGFADADFIERTLTLTQPTPTLRQPGFDARQLDSSGLASLRNGLQGRFLDTVRRDCVGGDQLTHELTEFVHCLRFGSKPRVDGSVGRDAVALAEQVLLALEQHHCAPSARPLFTHTGQDQAA